MDNTLNVDCLALIFNHLIPSEEENSKDLQAASIVSKLWNEASKLPRYPGPFISLFRRKFTQSNNWNFGEDARTFYRKAEVEYKSIKNLNLQILYATAMGYEILLSKLVKIPGADLNHVVYLTPSEQSPEISPSPLETWHTEIISLDHKRHIPLTSAIYAAHVDCVQVILAEKSIDFTQRNLKKLSFLGYAFSRSLTFEANGKNQDNIQKIIELLLDYYPHVENDLAETILEEHRERDLKITNVEIVRWFFLLKKLNPDVKLEPFLSLAIELGESGHLKALIPFFKEEGIQNVFYECCCLGKFDHLLLLLEYDVDYFLLVIDSKNSLLALLEFFLRNQNEINSFKKILGLLLKHDSCTALHIWKFKEVLNEYVPYVKTLSSIVDVCNIILADKVFIFSNDSEEPPSKKRRVGDAFTLPKR